MKKENVLEFYHAWIEALEGTEVIEQLLDDSLEVIYSSDEQLIISYDKTDGILILDSENLEKHYPNAYHIILNSTHDSSNYNVIDEIEEKMNDLFIRLGSRLELEENQYGYKIDIKNLEVWHIETIVKMMHDKLMKTWTKKNSVNIELYCDYDQIDYYVMYVSEGTEGLVKKLNEWVDVKPHYIVSLDEYEAMEYIEKRIAESFLTDEDEVGLQDVLSDYDKDESDYLDVNLSSIVDYLINYFYSDDETTKHSIDLKLNDLFGYYGTSQILKVNDLYHLIMD